MKDLCLYTYINDGWESLVMDNKVRFLVQNNGEILYVQNRNKGR